MHLRANHHLLCEEEGLSLYGICVISAEPRFVDERGVDVRNAYGDVTYATAAEVSRNFGRWQDQALAGPVVVTHHGRPRVVVISAQHYDVMSGAESPAAEGGSDAARLQEVLAALQAFQNASAGGGAIRLSRRGVVAAIDETLARSLGLSADEAIGAPLTELVVQADRRRLTAALEACFDDGTAGRLDIGFRNGGLVNGGVADGDQAVTVSLGLAPLIKDGAVDGLVVAVTRAAPRDGVEIW